MNVIMNKSQSRVEDRYRQSSETRFTAFIRGIEKMKELKRNIAHILALCLMLTSIIPTYAAGITLPEWSIVLEETENEEAVLMAAAGSQEPVSYLDWDEGQKKLVPATCSEYIEITSNGPYSLEEGAWYVVKGEVTITDRITNNGTAGNPAHLILTDGCTFSVPAGIYNRTYKVMQDGSEKKSSMPWLFTDRRIVQEYFR